MDSAGFMPCRWSEIKVESIDYVIQIVTHKTSDQLTCWLSDFSSIWHETITVDNMLKRYKECNHELQLNDERQLTLLEYSAHPENANSWTIVRNEGMLKLQTKNYITVDDPLEFHWSLEKVSDPAIFGKFTKSVLTDIIKLQRFNESMKKCTVARNESSTPFTHPKIDQVLRCGNCSKEIFGTRTNCIDCRDYGLHGKCVS